MIREARINALVMGALLLVPLGALWLDAPFTITLATRAAILGLAAVGLNIALGQGGLVSLGHAAFFGIGGYAMGILAFHAQTFTPVLDWGVTIPGTTSMPVIWLVAIAASALAALAIGALSLRTSGVYFIMITLAFGQMLYYLAVSLPAYGGEDGLSIYMRNGFPGLNTLRPFPFFALAYALLLLALLLSWRIAVSPFGLALSAARQSEARVRTVGIEPTRLRLVAFVISGAITGLAGALFADLNRFVSPAMLSWHLSGELIVLIVLGGVGRLMGPVVGACLFVTLEHWLGGVWDHWLHVLGAALLSWCSSREGGLIGALAAEGGP
jgi:branched-chain amino acid transport system permease protein